MKPGRRLERKTPLRNRKPMKRGTVTSLSTKRKYEPTEKPCKDAVKKRSEGMCEICGIRPGQSVHHRRKQSQQGPWTPSNCLHLCGTGRGPDGCHGMVTDTDGEYYENGWLVYSYESWLEKPLLYRGRWVKLDDSGDQPQPFEFRKAA